MPNQYRIISPSTRITILNIYSMAQTPDTDDLLILAARLYFLDGMSQSTIADLMNVSQAKVSRLLAQARERGLVRISVPEYKARDAGLEAGLKQALDLDAVVIRSFADLLGPDLRLMVGHFAAPIVGEWLGAAKVVAVAGGRTVQALVGGVRPSAPIGGLELIQAMGNIDANPGPYDASELARLLARNWGGRFQTLNSPALLPDPETCRNFLALEAIQKVLRRLEEADFALVGVGTLKNSVFLERSVLAPQDVEILRASGAVGEILGRFYDASGQECRTPFRERVVSLGLDGLRRVRRVIGVVSGSDRGEAILGAVRGGLLKGLVIDDGGASALLKAARDDPRPAEIGPGP